MNTAEWKKHNVIMLATDMYLKEKIGIPKKL